MNIDLYSIIFNTTVTFAICPYSSVHDLVTKCVKHDIYYMLLRGCNGPNAGTVTDHTVARPRGATRRPRSGMMTQSARLWPRRSSQEELPHVQGAAAARAQEGRKELLHLQGQEGWPEEITLVQGKRNPSKRVGVPRGHQGQTNWNHNHRKLVSLITGPEPCLTQWN